MGCRVEELGFHRLRADGSCKARELDEVTKALLWKIGGEVDLGMYRTWLEENVRR